MRSSFRKQIFSPSIPIVPFTTDVLTDKEKSLFFYPTNSRENKKVMRKLKNHEAAGLDGLTAEILKVSLDVVCDGLTYFVNESLSSGGFPLTDITELIRINFHLDES